MYYPVNQMGTRRTGPKGTNVVKAKKKIHDEKTENLISFEQNIVWCACARISVGINFINLLVVYVQYSFPVGPDSE